MRDAPQFIVERWECTEGMTVSIFHTGTHVRTGTVETAAPSGMCVWIAAGPADGRKLVHRSEGYVMTVDEQFAAALNGLREVPFRMGPTEPAPG